jgi:hypothetical protein
VENPNLLNSIYLPNSQFENLQSDYLIKTTKSFELHGAVKSIIEIITSDQIKENPIQTIRYTFLENTYLLSYQEDTLDSWINSNSKVEKYTYDSAHQKLLKAEHWDGIVGINCKSSILFDTGGFVVQNQFEKHQTYSGSDAQYPKNIFDYVLTYEWNKSRDSVQLDYTYKTAKTHYARQQNRRYSFVGEKERSAQKSNQIKKGKYKPSRSIFTEQLVKKDDNGNILKWTIIDHTIQGSLNVDQLYKYTYNKKNELTKTAYYTTTRRPDFILRYTYDINYLQYDELGNWTVRTVTTTKGAIKFTYTYKREISYF